MFMKYSLCSETSYVFHPSFFLTSLYAAQNKSGSAQPEQFDGAYLIKRYSSEYDLPDIPKFVKKIIIPITYWIGKLLGKYSHFKNAPDPVHANENYR